MAPGWNAPKGVESEWASQSPKTGNPLEINIDGDDDDNDDDTFTRPVENLNKQYFETGIIQFSDSPQEQQTARSQMLVS